MGEQRLVLCVLATLATVAFTPTLAQNAPGSGQFYIDWDNKAGKCIIVTEKPTDKTIEGGGPFKTRAEAQAAFKTVKGCS